VLGQANTRLINEEGFTTSFIKETLQTFAAIIPIVTAARSTKDFSGKLNLHSLFAELIWQSSQFLLSLGVSWRLVRLVPGLIESAQALPGTSLDGALPPKNEVNDEQAQGSVEQCPVTQHTVEAPLPTNRFVCRCIKHEFPPANAFDSSFSCSY